MISNYPPLSLHLSFISSICFPFLLYSPHFSSVSPSVYRPSLLSDPCGLKPEGEICVSCQALAWWGERHSGIWGHIIQAAASGHPWDEEGNITRTQWSVLTLQLHEILKASYTGYWPHMEPFLKATQTQKQSGRTGSDMYYLEGSNRLVRSLNMTTFHTWKNNLKQSF